MADLFGVPYFGFGIEAVRHFATRKGVEHSGVRTSFELIYKLSGHSTQTIDGKTFEFFPDDVLLLPKGCRNHAAIDEDGEVISVFFKVDGEGEFDFEHFRFRPHNAVKSLFLKLLRASASERRAARFERDAALCSIFAELVGEKEKQYFSEERYRKIAPAVEYVRAHFAERISVPQLAALCSASPTYLRELFRYYFGQGPAEYVIRIRLERAQQLLQRGGASVAEIAEACGFESAGYFSRAYKKRYGATPVSARKRYGDGVSVID